MNFQTSVEYLYSLGYELSVKKFGLENTIKLLAALENPERNYLKIQIAGTNGKGSTCAFLEAICLSANLKIGLYTSPHLISITERIRTNGAEISEADFARHAKKVKRISESLIHKGELETAPTFFEQVTAIALSFFAEQRVEIVILETGLGGRFDATTAARAEIVALTPIDFDHQNILGNSLTEIAAEKAATIRADTRVVLAEQSDEAERTISKVCAELGVTPKSAQTVLVKETDEFQTLNFQTERAEYRNVKLSLLGRHQIENAKVAVVLAETLQEDGFEIAAENIVEGLQTAEHKGRLEFRGNFLFDGAHNVAGAKALKEFLDEFVEQPITMVFGSMEDKDLSEISKILFPKAEYLILTTPNNPRSMTTMDLFDFISENFNRDNVFYSSNAAEAIEKAREISSDKNLICITGSLYLVGEVQKMLNNKSEI